MLDYRQKICPQECPPSVEATPTCEADEADKADIVDEDKDMAFGVVEPVADKQLDPLEAFFQMTREQVISIWEEAGRPVIHLGPGENCFGLDKLLSHRDINERHLVAIKNWLEERQR
jgi:hypothetical protein